LRASDAGVAFGTDAGMLADREDLRSWRDLSDPDSKYRAVMTGRAASQRQSK